MFYRYIDSYKTYQVLLNGKADTSVIKFLSEHHFLEAFGKVSILTIK